MKTILLVVLIATLSLLTACGGGGEAPAGDAATGAPAAGGPSTNPGVIQPPQPKEFEGELMTIQEQTLASANNLVVVLMNETGTLTVGDNAFAVEFRRDGMPVDVGSAEIHTSLEMPGAEPTVALMSSSMSLKTGRYNAAVRIPSAGTWKVSVTLGSGTVVSFDVPVQ